MVLAGCFSKLSRPMPPFAYFGIESSGLNLAVDLLILFVAVLYFALVYWTYADARRRIEDPMLVGCALVAALFPFVGPIVYMVVRPPEYLEDVHERTLETQAAQARLRELEKSLCPHCDYRIEADFIRCPSCLRKLKDRCANCSRPLEKAWTICPYCEADVPPMASARSRRRGARLGDGAGELGELSLEGDGQAGTLASDIAGAPVGADIAGAPAGEELAEPGPALAASAPDVEQPLSPRRPQRTGRSSSRPRRTP
jgi:hypothetical protein